MIMDIEQFQTEDYEISQKVIQQEQLLDYF